MSPRNELVAKIERKKKTNNIRNSGIYFMLSVRISRNIGENIFRSYTGSTSENTDFHVLGA